jgi:hypothetical protein
LASRSAALGTLKKFAYDHCLSLDMIKVDPLAGIKLAKMKRSGGYHTWTEEEIAQYEARHAALGTFELQEGPQKYE